MTEVFCALVLHWHYPFNFPIFNPGAFAYDLLSFQGQFRHFHQADFFTSEGAAGFGYPATAALPYWIFYSFGRFTAVAFYGFSLLVVAISGWLLGRAWVRRGVPARTTAFYLTACIFLSYPFWFQFKDGNMEIVLFALTILGVWMFVRGQGWASATIFGIATAMKIFPFVYLGLFVARKQYGKAAFALLVAVLANFVSTWAVCPLISYSSHRVGAGLHSFRDGIMVVRLFPEGRFDHSLFGLIKALFPTLPGPAIVAHWLNAYLLVAAVTGILLFFLRIRKLPLVNQVLCLTVASILLPPFSLDYTLMHLYISWAMLTLLILDKKDARIPGLALIVGCLVLLCAPLSEFIFKGGTFEGQIKSVVLLVLWYAALRYPLAEGAQMEESLPGRFMEPVRLQAQDGFAR